MPIQQGSGSEGEASGGSGACISNQTNRAGTAGGIRAPAGHGIDRAMSEHGLRVGHKVRAMPFHRN